MQWSTEPHGGFTKGEKPILPVISEGPFGFPHVNAAQQRRDPNSLLNWMERAIRMRKEVPEISWGDFQFIATRNSSVMAMQYEWRNNTVLIVHNFKDAAQEISFTLPGDHARNTTLVSLLSEEHSHADKAGRHHVALEPYGYRWFRVGGLDYLLRRTEVDKGKAERKRKSRKRK
jgi:maltose alpha-D-glucosyltransferase/alpha-amylase